MHDDDEQLPKEEKGRRKPKIDNAAALPAQLGEKLRSLFTDVESQPIPDRLRELLEALAAKEKKTD